MTSTITSGPLADVPEYFDQAARGVPEDIDSLQSVQTGTTPPPATTGSFSWFRSGKAAKPAAKRRRPKGFSKSQKTQLRELVVSVVVPDKRDDQSDADSWRSGQEPGAELGGGEETERRGEGKSDNGGSGSQPPSATPRETIKLLVLWPCSHMLVKRKIEGGRNIAVEDQRLVYRGRLLHDEDCVDESAFHDVDEDGFMNGIRLVLPDDGTYNADGSKYSSLTKLDEEDEEDAERALQAKLEAERLRAKLRQMRAQENAKFDKLLKAQRAFNLRDELARLECEQYADVLNARGFNEKGAFAQMTDEELAGPDLWIPKKWRRRIMALAEMYRQQHEREDAGRTTTITKVQHASKTHYTVDGSQYFVTMDQLQTEWAEAHQYFSMVDELPDPAGGKTAERGRGLEDSGPGEGGGGNPADRDTLAARVLDAGKLEEERQRAVGVLERYTELRKRGRVLKRKQLQRHERVPARPHGTQASRVMRKIDRDNRRDDWGLLTRSPMAPHKFCCAKHAMSARHRLKQYLDLLRAEVINWLRDEIDELDRGADGFIPVSDLRDLASAVLFEYGVEPTEALLGSLIRQILGGDDLLTANTTKLIRLVEQVVVDAEANRLRTISGQARTQGRAL